MTTPTTGQPQSRDWAVHTAPGGLPLLGHVLPLRRDPLRFLAALPAHGDLVEIRLGRHPAYLACHPRLVQQVLADARTFDKGGPFFEKVRPLLGNGLGTSGWHDHRRQRRLMQPAFQRERIATYGTEMIQGITAATRAWKPGQTVDVSAAMQAVTARVTTRALFSTAITDQDVTDIQHCLTVLFSGVYRRMTAPLGLWENIPTSGNRQFRSAHRRLGELIDQIIQHHPRTSPGRNDLLTALITAYHRTSNDGEVDRLTVRELHDQVMTLLVAGAEPTGHALSWALHLISHHPEVEARLHTEAAQALGDRPARITDLPRLEYTRRVFTEVLRLYPPGWMFTRTTTTEAELAGRRLQPGTTVLYSPYALHRDPRLFPAPEVFDPDRWLPDRARDVPRGAFIPFGAGNRKCIGEHFGITQALLALSTLCSRWQLRPLPGTEVRPKPETTLGTGPLLMVTRLWQRNGDQSGAV
ncbi:cytochrome P450 [Streptomyces candidus]|uniref:Pentalenene oxygenase n=1 Tax=Streptomyces candidus TaxID=67283 RepID=A0A7X0LSS8_9ACTN|nr:cytochrome P450 [Streptomyces candidus]MBB6439527.1 pentalenene oxygenase [Streptomyces candidus]